MNVCFCSGKPNGHCHITGTERLCRCHFCELNFLLSLGYLE